MSSEHFKKIIKTLKNNFPYHKIIIVSDKLNSKFFKKINHKNRFGCLFSKNFSNSVIGDGYIILKSDFYFQLFGGGMCVFPTFSKVPCLLNHKYVNNEVFFSDQKATFWQSKNQTITANANSKIFFDKLKLINSKQLSV